MEKSQIHKELLEIYPNLIAFSISQAIKHQFDNPKEIAQDCVMESIAAFFEYYRRNKKIPDNLKAYLITIIKNKYLEWKRQKNKKMNETFSEEYRILIDGNQIEPEPEPGLRQRIEQAFSKLSGPCKKLLKLQDNGYTYTEIAERLNTTKNGVAGQLSRCRTSLVSKLSKEKIDRTTLILLGIKKYFGINE